MSTIHAAGAVGAAFNDVGDVAAVNAPGGTVTINATNVDGVSSAADNNLTIDGGGSLTTLSLKAGTVKAGFDDDGGAAFTVDPIQTVAGVHAAGTLADEGMRSGAIVTIGRPGDPEDGVKGLLQFKSLKHDSYFKFANDDDNVYARLKLAYVGSGPYKDLLQIQNNGRIGIGTTRPEVPLDVRGGQDVNTGPGQANTSLWLHGHSTWTWNIHGTNHPGGGAGGNAFGYVPQNSTVNVSIYGERNFLTAIGYLNSSDERIKTDIENVSDDKALQQVNALECKEYHYIDPLRRKEIKTIGFIAQEVKEVLPNAVGTTKEYVPDELRSIENPKWSQDGNKHILTIDDLELSDSHTGVCKFYVCNDADGKDEVMKEVDVNDDKKSFTFDQKYEKVFLHGKQVNDFHAIDKNQIFALHHSAIQELSRKHDACLLLLEEENSQLRSRLDSLEAAVAALQK